MVTLIRLAENATSAEHQSVFTKLELAGLSPRVHGQCSISVAAGPAAPQGVLAGERPVTEVIGLDIDNPCSTASGRAGRRSTVPLGNAVLGSNDFVVIAGPCSVENREQLLNTAGDVLAAGAHALRGGLFKPRSSPYGFQGLGRSGIALVDEVRAATGLPFVTEVVDVRDVEKLCAHVDMLQVGARNMQNFALLRELGACGVPVLLKRGLGSTIDEMLLAAEYLLAGGNEDVVLCERGIRTFERSYRFTLDITAVPVLQERTHLPVIIDPSHAAGAARWVPSLALAAAAAGADGIIVESHWDPSAALCDGQQALPSDELADLMTRVRIAAAAAGRTVSNGAAERRLVAS